MKDSLHHEASSSIDGVLYSADVPTQIAQMETELATLPQCSGIKWYRSKRGFSASINGLSKWFSAYSRGVTNAWQLAFQWLETQKELAEQSTTVHQEQDEIEPYEEYSKEALNDETDKRDSPLLRPRRRMTRTVIDQSDAGVGSGSGVATSSLQILPDMTSRISRLEEERRISTTTKRPRMDSTASQESVESGVSGAALNLGICRMVETAQKAEEDGTWDSDDSCDDMNEQAKRLPKTSNICWVPQKQVSCRK